MVLMLCMPDRNNVGKRLAQVLAHLIPDQSIELCYSVDELSDRLCMPVYDISALVMFTRCQDDLEEILEMREHLGDMRTIVILPDSDPFAVTLAHILRPRYVTWADGDLSGAGIMLRRLIDHHEHQLMDHSQYRGMTNH